MNTLNLQTKFAFGEGTSPVLHGDTLIVNWDHEGESFIASLDARISRAFDVRRGSLTVFVEVSNLLDHNNLCCIDYDLETDENGDEFLESSPDYLLPLLPAVGILWEF